MPLIKAAEVYRLVQSGRYQDDILIQNVWHFGRENAGGTPGELLNDWNSNIIGQMATNFINVVNFTDISVQRIAPDESEIERISGNYRGSHAGQTALPCVAAGIVTWRTQLAGRSHRGRSYFTGMPYDSVTWSDGTGWTSYGLGTLDSIANLIRLRYQLGGNPGAYMLGVWSRKLGGALPPRDAAAGWTMVASHTSQSYIGSMGTRRLGHGL